MFNWLFPSKELIENRELTIGDQVVLYTLKKRSTARHIRLEVTLEKGLTVFAPMRASDAFIKNTLLEKQTWILEKTAFYKQFPREADKFLEDGSTISYLGKECKVFLLDSRTPKVKLHGDAVFLYLPRRDSLYAKRCLRGWFQRQAKQVLGERVELWKEKLDVNVGRIAIRGQRTRWGSCSSRGNLNFNWKLVMAPLEVIDYLVVHELTHLSEMHHGKRFWEKVELHCPDYVVQEKWLKEYGPRLSF